MVIKIDFNSDEALYMQLRNQIIVGIATAQIQEGESLPSVRQLADTVGINMHTVNKAYTLLKQEGFITTDRRGGTVVTGSPESGELGAHSREGLRLIAAEARLSGISEDDFLTLCRELYREGGGEK